MTVLISTNQYSGLQYGNRPRLSSIQLINNLRMKWHFHLWDHIRLHAGSQYSYRRRLVADAICYRAGFIDVYGRGWDKHPEKLFRIWPRTQAYPSFEWLPVSKAKILENYKFCFVVENFCGSLGYISEKIYDVMACGVVPVYLGDEYVHQVIPRNCFVDLRSFASHQSLFHYLDNISEAQWQAYIEAGKIFMESTFLQKYSTKPFAETALRIITDTIE